MNKMDERIIVVEREYLFEKENLAFQGVLTDPVIVKHISGKFRGFFEARRGDAETREQWKQPIPYVIIRRGEEVFLYERLKAGGEERLHNQLSIGVGGHMNVLEDNGRWTPNFMSNMYRELDEELNINIRHSKPEIIGLINDDENEVGRVHIGILVVIDIPEDEEVTVKETDKLEGYWVRIRDIKKPPLYSELEAWSRIAAEIL